MVACLGDAGDTAIDTGFAAVFLAHPGRVRTDSALRFNRRRPLLRSASIAITLRALIRLSPSTLLQSLRQPLQ
jgi:hypothetical protein